MVTSARRLILALLVAGSAALAAPGVATAGTSGSADGSRVTRERAVVSQIAHKDKRPDVVDAAWLALLSPRGATAISDFLAPGGGLARAVARAGQAGEIEQWHNEMIALVLAETTPQSDPHLHAAAVKASTATAADKETFIVSGLDAARKADEQAAREHDAAEKRALRADLDFVTELSAKDPGVQVRGEAKWVAGDTNRLRQFLTSNWARAAELDTQAYNTRVAEQETRWRTELGTLTDAATTARAAEASSSGAARQRAHMASTAAWQRVLTHAETAARGWATEQALAARHAEVWAWVAEHAKTGTSGRDWAAVTTTASTARQQWTARRDEARRTAAAWTEIATRARAQLT